MSLEKTLRMGQLFATYQKLLTDKQREMLAMYYEEDFSLSEIAEHYAISRQAVYDNLRRGEAAIEDYEVKLQLEEKRKERLALLEELRLESDLSAIQAISRKLIELEE